MHKDAILICLVLLTLALSTISDRVWGSHDLADAIAKGQMAIEFRYRYDFVDQDGYEKQANASILKSRLSWDSGVIDNFSAKVEVDNVSSIIVDDYNDTVNGQTQYPKVVDPQGTEINQVYLQYQHQGLTVNLGRQRILHGDQHFVGNANWRHHERTFDGYRFRYDLDSKRQVDYSYLHNMNTKYGPHSDKSNQSGDFHLLQYLHQLDDKHRLAAFIYQLDFDQRHEVSATTYGFSYAGKLAGFKLNASYAKQQDSGDNPNDYQTDFKYLQLARYIDKFAAGIGRQVLGSDNQVGFSTPFGSTGELYGYSEKFINTPEKGLNDTYVFVSYQFANRLKLKSTYHHFESDHKAVDYGKEINLLAIYPQSERVEWLFKYVDYQADTKSKDTKKISLMVSLSY